MKRATPSIIAAALIFAAPAAALAQVNGSGQCIPTPSGKYVDDAGTHAFHFICCMPFLIYDPSFTELVLHDLNGCGSPPPSVPDAESTIAFSGLLDFVVTSEGSSSSGYANAWLTMVSRFNHESGATRYFDIDVSEFNVQFLAEGTMSGAGNGVMTIEDLGAGVFRITNELTIGLQMCLVSYSSCSDDLGAGAAHFTLTSTTLGVPWERNPALTLGSPIPSPVRTHAQVHFSLPSDGPATLRFYDVAGRPVATLLDGMVMTAGPHAVDLDTQGWRAGCYFYRLITQAGSQRHMMTVVP